MTLVKVLFVTLATFAALATAGKAPRIVGGKDAVQGQFPYQVPNHNSQFSSNILILS